MNCAKSFSRQETGFNTADPYDLAGSISDEEFARRLDMFYRGDLQCWLLRQSSRYFTKEEIRLQCAVALRYADRSRPTVRELWQYLQFLILKDEQMLGSAQGFRFPSYSTFRNRVADLPREFVRRARDGRLVGRPSVAIIVTRFEAIETKTGTI